jgi:hypothetical protein
VSTFPEIHSDVPDWWPMETCSVCNAQARSTTVQITRSGIEWKVRATQLPGGWDTMTVADVKYLSVCPDCITRIVRWRK